MKSDSLSIAAMRASRLFACVALAAGLAVLAGHVYAPAALGAALGALMSPESSLCAILLAVASLVVSVQSRWAQRVGQLLAIAAAALALQSWLAGQFGAWLTPGNGWRPLLFSQGAVMAGATALMYVATGLALVFVPVRRPRGTQLYAAFAAAGLLVTATSLVGLLLDSPTLASLGLPRQPMPASSVVAALLLLATVAQRGDAGWLSVLLGPSAAGSSARGIIAWTVLGPLAFAALALAGVREGVYDMPFAFALLAAAVCCGLTALVMWNAARVDRAQRRAESARDAEQLAANRLRLAKSATGIQMWEWLPATREWYSIDGSERLDPSTNEYLEAGLARAMRDGKAEFEFPLRRAGEPHERWMFATCWREVRDAESGAKFDKCAGITVDITERKHAAMALETSETRLQLAARALPGFVYDWNCASGKILRTSGIEQMLGYQGAEISPVSRWWEDLVHPDDRALALPARVARAAGPEHDIDSLACEYRVRHRDGRYLWIWDHCVLVRDRGNLVTRAVGTVLDITERREAAARLADSEHRFKAALLATTGIIWTHSPEGRAEGEQTSWSAFTGQSAEELAGMGWLNAVHPDDVDATREAWRAALASSDVLALIHRVRRHDGLYRTFSVRAVPVTGERGQIIEWVGAHTDITEQRELEAEREGLLNAERAARSELVTAAQAKDEFLATISHELRSPLNAILGWTTLLQRPRVDAATIRDGLKVIERNARAQTQLLGDLLDANQLMSGKLSLSFEPMDFNESVRATLDSMRVSFAARKVRIEAQIPEPPLPVMGDSVRLQQVVSNLLSNAVKFTPVEGVIAVTTGADAESAWCEVRDSGEGISAEFLPHIFEKFRQADVGSARRFAGLGLGLAITKELVESHGGSIHVHSDGRGKGAAFTIRVPRLRSSESTETAAAPRASRATDKPLAGIRILAVDDEADSREYLQRLLAEQGADIVSVSSAAEALDVLSSQSGRFNLLVSDIGMPGSTGYDLIENVRQRLKVDARHLPAVALTAFARREDSVRALDKGFQKHLAKPVQVGRLIGAIRQLTGRQQSRAARRSAG